MLIRHAAVDRRARANEQRDATLAAGFVWKGAVFQIDAESHSAIAARALKVFRNPEAVVWRTTANESYPFSAEDFLAFADGVETYIEAVRQKCWNLKDR